MNGRALSIAIGIAAVMLAPAALHSQMVWSDLLLESRLGGASGGVEGTGAGFEIAPGLAWTVAAGVSVVSGIEVFAGVAHAGFGCRSGFCQDEAIAFRSRGAEAGVRAALPMATARLGPWARIAVLGHVLSWDAPDREGERYARRLGLEGGIEWRLPLTNRVGLAPGLRLSGYAAGSDQGQSRGVVFLRADVGIRVRPFAPDR